MVSGESRRTDMHPSSKDGPGTILVVEDDEQVRALICTLLSANGYRVLQAETGAEGLRVAEENSADINLMLSDMLLPELSGYDLAVQLRARFPQIAVLFMTGYVEGEIVQRCLTELDAGFLDKPFAPAALLQQVRIALGETSPAQT